VGVTAIRPPARQLIMYAGAVHAFTQKEAGDDPSRGAAYNAAADRRSWGHMHAFFDEIFK
jgi:dienelactone hydrolase